MQTFGCHKCKVRSPSILETFLHYMTHHQYKDVYLQEKEAKSVLSDTRLWTKGYINFGKN